MDREGSWVGLGGVGWGRFCYLTQGTILFINKGFRVVEFKMIFLS